MTRVIDPSSTNVLSSEASPFLRATTWQRLAPGRYQGQIDPAWYQGRGAFGGVLAAAILRALRREITDDERVPRSLTVHFAAPAVAGPVELEARIEREGTRVTHASARILQDGQPTTLATATFACSRREAVHYDRARMPEVPPAPAVAPAPPSPLFPTFVQFYEHAFALGAIPYTGAKEPVMGGWTRLRAPVLLDAPAAAAYLDSWPPAVLAVLDAPRAAASVDFTIHFFEPFPVAGVGLESRFLVTVESRWAGDGYTEELRELWSEDGRRIAQCRQLIALLA